MGSVLISTESVHNKKVRYHISEPSLATKIPVDVPTDTKVLVLFSSSLLKDGVN